MQSNHVLGGSELSVRGRVYTRSSICVREKVGLSGGGGGDYRRTNTVGSLLFTQKVLVMKIIFTDSSRPVKGSE